MHDERMFFRFGLIVKTTLIVWGVSITPLVLSEDLHSKTQMKPGPKSYAAKAVVGSQQQNKRLIARGKALFLANQCLDCHKVGERGCVEGISLDGIGQLRSNSFLTAQLADPEKHVTQVLKNYHGETNLMTAPNLDAAEIRAVIAYLKTIPALKN